jgi:hypothetical protein
MKLNGTHQLLVYVDNFLDEEINTTMRNTEALSDIRGFV